MTAAPGSPAVAGAAQAGGRQGSYSFLRPRAGGEVTLSLLGPARLVGDNPFDFGRYGGVGGAFVRSLPGPAGLVTVTAWHATLGRASVRVRVAPVPVRQR